MPDIHADGGLLIKQQEKGATHLPSASHLEMNLIPLLHGFSWDVAIQNMAISAW